MKNNDKGQNVSSIRVETQKLDSLVDLVSEMTIGIAQLNQIAIEKSYIQDRNMHIALENIKRFSREMQEQVMRIRMVPIEGTFNRYFRIVRDLSRELNKKIKLEISGGETELDKNVIEKLGDPLKHLIRNSVDHGIEPPEERVRKGKPEEGLIRLRAYQQEGSIYIEVCDDGGGIDTDKLCEIALRKN